MLAGNLVVQWALLLVNINNGPNLIGSPVVAFLVELPTVFCLVFLLAGLTLSLSSKNGGPVSFFDGLPTAKKYLTPLIGWSVVVALAGTLLFSIGSSPSALKSSLWLWSPLYTFLRNVLMQYPFNWTLNPNVFITIAWPPGGEFSLGVGFPDAFIYTLIFLIINTFLFVMTLFVVPQLVLEKKRLKGAVSGSFTLMKNIRGEVAACVLGLGMVVFAALLTFPLFQFTGISQVTILSDGISISSSRPADAWIAFGFLYILALSGFALVVATVGGIATLDLHTIGKIRESMA